MRPEPKHPHIHDRGLFIAHRGKVRVSQTTRNDSCRQRADSAAGQEDSQHAAPAVCQRRERRGGVWIVGLVLVVDHSL